MRSDCREVVNKLQNTGIKLSLLTGDHKRVAKNIAEQVKIGDYYAGLFPQDKVSLIERFESKGEKNLHGR